MSLKPLQTRVIDKIFNGGEQRFYPQYRESGLMMLFGWVSVYVPFPESTNFVGRTRDIRTEFERGFYSLEAAKNVLTAIEDTRAKKYREQVKNERVITFYGN